MASDKYHRPLLTLKPQEIYRVMYFILRTVVKEGARIEIQPRINPISYEKPAPIVTYT